MDKHSGMNDRSALGIPNNFMTAETSGKGDCFFDSLAKGMNQLCITGGPFDVKTLRSACRDYAQVNKDCVFDTQDGKTWHQVISEDAAVGGYASNCRNEHDDFESYLVHILMTEKERRILNLGDAICGRPMIEGHMLCHKYGIKLHFIGRLEEDGQDIICHLLVDSLGSRSVDEKSSLYNDPQMIHILNEGLSHFVPILRNTSESIKSDDQEQEIYGRYLKEYSLTDESTWSAVASKKADPDFKILRIRNSATASAALDFMQQEEFYENFNQATHLFFIVIQVDDWSEIPSEALKCFSECVDAQRPVIIQWDFMDSAKHLVLFKRPGDCAFTPVEMDSDSWFNNETELKKQISTEGNFQLPLLLNALQLGISGQFNGDVLDLLKVSFDVKEEIESWRLVDYAARNDDSLSLRFLMLADWDLDYQNSYGMRTLEIAAEYASPQSLTALLNLPINSIADEFFVSEKGKELLSLTDDQGDNPLLIAAEKGKPETLKFLTFCNINIQCYRRGIKMCIPIELAWDKKRYENVQVLLEADSPFPANFNLECLERSEVVTALRKLVEERQKFHESIKEGLKDAVKEFITCYPRLKCAYDPANYSAMKTALKEEQFEIYALLKSKEFCAGRDEELSEVLEGLTMEQKYALKHAMKKYFRKQIDSHIDYLVSKSKQKSGKEDRKKFIQELYKQLDAIPEISTILKVVEHCEKTEIVFDFDSDSVVDLDPTQTSSTKGACNYKEGHIYVGAKEESELVGTLAHELTHLAMQVCYNNECSPYEESDEKKKSDFDKIVSAYYDRHMMSEYHATEKMDAIIERVFTVYKQRDWPSELIVRVPHLLAHYSGEDKKLLRQKAPDLFDFYEQQTQEDLRSFLEDPAYFKARHEVQDLNKLLGKLVELEESNIWLNDEHLLNDDVINCEKFQILRSSLPRLTVLNVFQVLRKKAQSVSEISSKYIFVSAEEFANERRREIIRNAFQSDTHTKIVIDCSSECERTGIRLRETVQSFDVKRRIIFIALPELAESLQDKWKIYDSEIVRDREYGWSDLTPESQNELLKNKVIFQGKPMVLNELFGADSPLTSFLPLADLLSEITLEIGKDMLKSPADGYSENYYVGRTLNQQAGIKLDILKKEFPDMLAFTEQEFKQCCEDKPNRNVHWLVKNESGRLVWQQSKGSLKALHAYIDSKKPICYPPENLDKLLEKDRCQKVMLIADVAGMGKSTVLTHLYKQIKEKYPTYWVVRIDLTDQIDVLEAQSKQKISAIDFLSEKHVTFPYEYEKEMFKHCLEGRERRMKIVLMFDGFDEISPKYKDTVIDLLEAVNPMRVPGIWQLWVTTRPHLKEELEDKLQQLCYTLSPFCEDDQVKFFTKFWPQKLRQGISEERLAVYARALIKELSERISDKEKDFTGIPLQTRMVAESFLEESEKFCLSQESEPELPKILNLVDLYSKFIANKMQIYIRRGKIAIEQQSSSISAGICIRKNHQKLALELLFPRLADEATKADELKLLSREEIVRIGIVQYVNDKPHFIHRTFSEYYVAEFVVTKLAAKQKSLEEVHECLLSKILQQKECVVIRLFLDGLLLTQKPSELNLKQYGERINKCWEQYLVILHQTAREGTRHIIGLLLNSLKTAGHSETISKMLLKRDRYNRGTWLIAAMHGHRDILEELWSCAIEVKLNVRDDLLLAKDKYGQTAWIMAARNGCEDILEKLWSWAVKLEINLKDDLLLAKKDGETAWNMAARKGREDILEKLWSWAVKLEINLKDDLFVAKDMYGEIAWFIAVRKGRVDILKKLWSWAVEHKIDPEDFLFLVKTGMGKLP